MLLTCSMYTFKMLSLDRDFIDSLLFPKKNSFLLFYNSFNSKCHHHTSFPKRVSKKNFFSLYYARFSNIEKQLTVYYNNHLKINKQFFFCLKSLVLIN